MKSALLFALLATSPQPGAEPPHPPFDPGAPMVMRGRDGGEIGALRGPTRIEVGEKGTVRELLTALRAHVEPLRGESTTCWVRLGQWVMNHPRVELVVAGTFGS